MYYVRQLRLALNVVIVATVLLGLGRVASASPLTQELSPNQIPLATATPLPGQGPVGLPGLPGLLPGIGGPPPAGPPAPPPAAPPQNPLPVATPPPGAPAPPAEMPGRPGLQTATPVPVGQPAPPAAPTPADFTTRPGPRLPSEETVAGEGAIAGRVTTPAGVGLPGVRIRARAMDGSLEQEGVTGPDGSFRIGALPGGSYSVYIVDSSTRVDFIFVQVGQVTTVNFTQNRAPRGSVTPTPTANTPPTVTPTPTTSVTPTPAAEVLVGVEPPPDAASALVAPGPLALPAGRIPARFLFSVFPRDFAVAGVFDGFLEALVMGAVGGGMLVALGTFVAIARR